MKRVLLTGKNGQVGWELQRTLAPLGDVCAFDHAGLDLSQHARIVDVIRDLKPDVIINAAAYTAVDKAESEPNVAMAINGTAPGVLAEEAKRLGALLVHYSTDYVFDGRKPTPYTEDDSPNPISTYGRSKLAGERAIADVGGRHLILRTSWVYGMRGHNFLRTMLRLSAERKELRVVDDQIGKPTWSRIIAETTALLLATPTPPQGLFHCASEGETSWHGFTEAILERSCTARKHEPRLLPIPTSAYPLPAARPGNSRLNCARLAQQSGLRLPDWRTALDLCLADNDRPT